MRRPFDRRAFGVHFAVVFASTFLLFLLEDLMQFALGSAYGNGGGVAGALKCTGSRLARLFGCAGGNGGNGVGQQGQRGLRRLLPSGASVLPFWLILLTFSIINALVSYFVVDALQRHDQSKALLQHRDGSQKESSL